MTPEQFWHGDMVLLEIYQKAYYTDKSYTTWQQGQYTFIATTIALNNMWAKDKSKRIEYPKWESPNLVQERKEPISKDNLEIKYRKENLKQHNWLNKLLQRERDNE
jgi:hypothetical protein